MDFLPIYVVGFLGIIFFNLGTALNACVIEAPPGYDIYIQISNVEYFGKYSILNEVILLSPKNPHYLA